MNKINIAIQPLINRPPIRIGMTVSGPKGDKGDKGDPGEVTQAEFDNLAETVTTLQEDVSVNLMTAQLSLSTADSIKSVSANVGSVPKVRIVAPDMLMNLLGRDGDMESLAGWSTSSDFAVLSLDSSSKMFGNNSIRMTWTHETTAQPGIVKDITSKVNPSKYYLLSAYTKCATANHVDIRFRINGSTDKTSSSNTVADKFTRLGVKISPSDMVGLTKLEILLVMGADLNEYANFDGVALYEITESEYNNLTINQVMAKYPYINGVQPILNPCLTVRGKNLVNEKEITAVGSYIKPTWTGEKLLFDNSSNTADRALTRFPVILEKGKTYRVSKHNEVIISGSTVLFRIADSEGKSIATVYTTYTATYSGLHYLEAFTTIGSLQKIELNIQLEEGAVATDYEEYRAKQRIYPCTLGKVSFYADELTDDGIKAVKTWRVKKYVLQASDITNLIISGVNVDMLQIKKNLDYIGYNTTGSTFNYAKFIFEGFKAGHYTTADVDNIANIGIVTGGCDAITFRLPIAKGTYTNLAAAQAALTGTVLWYVLVQEEKEIIEPIGSLRIEQGYNCVDASSGIVYERAKPQLYLTTYVINFTTVPNSLLSKKTKRIISIFKNGVEDILWNITTSTANSYGEQYASIPNDSFDLTAIYTVLYEVLHEDYDSQQVNVIIEYADNLRTSHNQLVGNVAGLENEVNDHIFKTLNSHIKESGSNANGSYIKFEDGTMICTVQKKNTVDIGNSLLGGYTSVNIVWTFPAYFVSSPSISAMTDLGGLSAILGALPSTTGLNYRYAAVSSQASAERNIVFIAVGRWK